MRSQGIPGSEREDGARPPRSHADAPASPETLKNPMAPKAAGIIGNSPQTLRFLAAELLKSLRVQKENLSASRRYVRILPKRMMSISKWESQKRFTFRCYKTKQPSSKPQNFLANAAYFQK